MEGVKGMWTKQRKRIMYGNVVLPERQSQLIRNCSILGALAPIFNLGQQKITGVWDALDPRKASGNIPGEIGLQSGDEASNQARLSAVTS